MAPEPTVHGGGNRGRTEPKTRAHTKKTGEGETSSHTKRQDSRKDEETERRDDENKSMDVVESTIEHTHRFAKCGR